MKIKFSDIYMLRDGRKEIVTSMILNGEKRKTVKNADYLIRNLKNGNLKIDIAYKTNNVYTGWVSVIAKIRGKA